MSDSMASIQLGQDIIKPIIDAKINTAILEAMKGHEALIMGVVGQILDLKVDGEGKVSNYNSGSNTTFLAYLVKKIINSAAEQAIKEFIEAKQPEFKDAITKQLESKAGRDKFARALLDGATHLAANRYRMNLNVEIKEGD